MGLPEWGLSNNGNQLLAGMTKKKPVTGYSITYLSMLFSGEWPWLTPIQEHVFFWPDSLLEIPHAVPHLRSDQTVEEAFTGWWFQPLWKIMEFVSWDADLLFPTEWTVIIHSCSKPPTRYSGCFRLLEMSTVDLWPNLGFSNEPIFGGF